MERIDGRKEINLRKLKVTKNIMENATGSVLMEFGKTKVLCTAMIEEKVPSFIQKGGWLTAEYSMLPGSTITRKKRDGIHTDGRTIEIRRLIGRSLRNIVDLSLIGSRTIAIDCDVIQADGGTRTCSITGAFIALVLAVDKLIKNGTIEKSPIKHFVGAVSVGIVDGVSMLDLCYVEDSKADVDMNIVMNDDMEYIEIQGTGEGNIFDDKQLKRLLMLANKGMRSVISFQKRNLNEIDWLVNKQ